MVEFWNENLTQESWKALISLSKKYKFILIGGWAAFLWTRTHKSKDIDIVVDLAGLNALRSEFEVQKNERMRKYEIRMEKFDIDIYLPFYSRLAIPLQDLGNYCQSVEGIKLANPQALLILKQAAEIDRRGSTKGRKDAIDIMCLLLYSGISLEKYVALLKKYSLKKYLGELIHVVANFDEEDIHYLRIGFVEFKKKRKGLLEKIKNLG